EPAAKPEEPAPSTTTTQDDKQPSAPAPGNPPVATPGADSAPATAQPTAESAPTNANHEDPTRPVLRRGQSETEGAAQPGASTGVPRRPTGAAATSETRRATPQQLPAISDAGGPEPRPYAYDVKPDEEQKYRKAMLALAAEAVRAKLKETAPVAPGAKVPARPSARTATKTAQPAFDDVQFRAFDLWNTNEPVFVLSVIAHAPKN